MFRVLRRMFCFQYSSPDIATASTEKKLGSLDHCSVRGVSNEALFGSKGVKETTSVDRIFKLNSHVTSLSHTLHKHSQKNTSKQWSLKFTKNTRITNKAKQIESLEIAFQKWFHWIIAPLLGVIRIYKIKTSKTTGRKRKQTPYI